MSSVMACRGVDGDGRVLVIAMPRRAGAMRLEAAADANEGTRTVGPTISSARGSCSHAPSLPTIARAPPNAMSAMARGPRNNERTQHRPERKARTGAPGHTRTAVPPRSSTSSYWTIVPVGYAILDDDENGADECVTCAPDRGGVSTWVSKVGRTCVTT